MDLASKSCLVNGLGHAAGFFGFFGISFSVSLLAPFGDRGWPPPTVFACEALAAAVGMAFAAADVLLRRSTDVLLYRFPIALLSRVLDRRVSLALRWRARSALVSGLLSLLLHISTLHRRLSGGLSLILFLCAPTFLSGFFPITFPITARLFWLLLSVSFDEVLRLFGDLLVGGLLSRPRLSAICWNLRLNLGCGCSLTIWITIPYGGIIHSRTLSPMGKHSIRSELEPRAK